MYYSVAMVAMDGNQLEGNIIFTTEGINMEGAISVFIIIIIILPTLDF